MKKHNINGLNVIENGENNQQALIFIHAFPLCNRMWDKQVEFFQNKYRVITYDLRGFGYSETGDALFTIDSHVEDIYAIMASLKIEKPVICGLSMGGYIALRALEMSQNKFRAAIICDSKSEADNNNTKVNRSRQIKQIRSGDKKTFFETLTKAAVSEKTFTENQKLVEYIITMMGWQKDVGVMGALMTLAARTDTTEALEKIDIPAMVIAGKDDKLTPPEYSKFIYGKIRNAHYAAINDSGHFSNMENPDEFNKVTAKFLTDTLEGKSR